jgi:hypothetical protein
LQHKVAEYEQIFRALAAERAVLIADRDNLHRKVAEQEESARVFDG